MASDPVKLSSHCYVSERPAIFQDLSFGLSAIKSVTPHQMKNVGRRGDEYFGVQSLHLRCRSVSHPLTSPQPVTRLGARFSSEVAELTFPQVGFAPTGYYELCSATHIFTYPSSAFLLSFYDLLFLLFPDYLCSLCLITFSSDFMLYYLV